MERRCYWVGGAGVRVNYTNLTLTVTEVNTAFHCKEEEEGDLSAWPRSSLCCSQNHVVVPNKASQHSTKTNVPPRLRTLTAGLSSGKNQSCTQKKTLSQLSVPAGRMSCIRAQRWHRTPIQLLCIGSVHPVSAPTSGPQSDLNRNSVLTAEDLDQ